MNTNLRDGLVHIRPGDWYAITIAPDWGCFVVARSHAALLRKVQRLRKRGHNFGRKCWRDVGCSAVLEYMIDEVPR